MARKTVCLTHLERLDANTGWVLVCAVIRTIEQPLPALVVMLPAEHLLVVTRLDLDARD